MEKRQPDFDLVYEQRFKGNSTDRKIGAGWKNEDGIYIQFEFGGSVKLKKREANSQNTTANGYSQTKERFTASNVEVSDYYHDRGEGEVVRINDYSKDGKPNFMIITKIDGEDKTLYANEPCNLQAEDQISFVYKKKDQRSAKGNKFSSVKFVKQVSPVNQEVSNEEDADIPF